MKARVSGLSVDRGLIGAVSPGTSPRILRLNLQYGAPSWNGFTVEANVEHEGRQMANRANTLEVPALTTLSVAARYPFAIGKARANVRVQLNNLTNTFAWTVEGNSGRFSTNQPRGIFFRFAADY
jgi:outer membrane receptor protein involved in Fe transport